MFFGVSSLKAARILIPALSGGLRYGSHDYLPNEKVLEICRKNPDWFVPMAKFD